jgi:hypothetical protein
VIERDSVVLTEYHARYFPTGEKLFLPLFF